jgi:hypothetical protein
MAKLKFPYTMHCPSCKTGLKIKNPKLVGTMINCPKCKKRIPVVTPEEDGYIPYGVEAPPEPEREPEPTEDDLEERRLQKLKEKRKAMWVQVRYIAGIFWLLLLLAGAGIVVYYFVDPTKIKATTNDGSEEQTLRLPPGHQTDASWC